MEAEVFLRAREVQEANQRLEAANRELARSEELFRLLVAGVKDYAIFMLDPQGRVSTWNEGAERIKGYTAEEIIGQHFSRFYPQEDIESGKPDHELEDRGLGGGVRRRGLARPQRRLAVLGQRGDHRAARQEWGTARILESDARLHRTQENRGSPARQRKSLSLALRVLARRHRRDRPRTGRIAEVNGQVAKFFGYDRAELIGQAVEMLIPERFRNAHPGHRKEYTGHPQTRPMGIGLELRGLRKDGTEFPVDIMLSPVETPGGRVVLSVIRDLSEKKQAEEELERRARENRYLEEELNTVHNFEEIIGESLGLKRVLKQVETVAATDVTVLILGETGTGKDLIARAIHNLSSRQGQTLVKLNCAAIPTGLLESELFGHEKGAFTGAISQKVGRLELAHRGTLFLDEVGDLPLELQPKLLRALQEKEFERLGGTRTIPVDARLDRRHESQPRKAGRRPRVSQRPLLPLARFPYHHSAVARTPRGYSAAGSLLRHQA